MTDPGRDSSIRVATWNLWWRFGGWERRQRVIGDLLVDLDADIIGLQEVWADKQRKQAEELAVALGYDSAWSPVAPATHWHDRLPGSENTEIGNAILSRWPIRNLFTLDLSDPTEPGAGRSAVLAEIDTPAGAIAYCTTQLTSTVIGGSAIRVRQAQRLANWLERHRGERQLVLVGDFNADPQADVIRRLGGYETEPLNDKMIFVDAWRYRGDSDPGYTWRRDNPHVMATAEPWARVDYIFTSPGPAGLPQINDVGLFGSEPLAGVHGSDHAGVWADLLPRLRSQRSSDGQP